jgi:hypothetical protein
VAELPLGVVRFLGLDSHLEQRETHAQVVRGAIGNFRPKTSGLGRFTDRVPGLGQPRQQSIPILALKLVGIFEKLRQLLPCLFGAGFEPKENAR